MKRSKPSDLNLTRMLRSALLNEQNTNSKSKKEDKKPKCIPENVIPLDEIVGRAEEYNRYTPGINKRTTGVNSMVDTLGILNNLSPKTPKPLVNEIIDNIINEMNS